MNDRKLFEGECGVRDGKMERGRMHTNVFVFTSMHLVPSKRMILQSRNANFQLLCSGNRLLRLTVIVVHLRMQSAVTVYLSRIGAIAIPKAFGRHFPFESSLKSACNVADTTQKTFPSESSAGVQEYPSSVISILSPTIFE